MEFLRSISLFKYLTTEEVEKVEKLLSFSSVKEGVEVFKEGDKGREMYLLAEGKVKITKDRKDKELVLVELTAPAFFGEMALITGNPRSATVKAMSDCSIYTLDKDGLDRLMDEEPSIAGRILLALCEELALRIARTNENLETYFLINQALLDNEQFRKLYLSAHKRDEG